MKVFNKKIIYICVLILVIMSILRGKTIQTPYLDTIAFMTNFITYLVMLLMWINSIYRRIMNKNIRRYLMFIGVLLIFWLFVRTGRHRIFLGQPSIQIFLWYCYYIPITLSPLICYYIALTIGNREGYVIDFKYKLLIILEIILVTSVLTNNSHEFAFTLPKEAIYFPGKGHGYGIIYYIVIAWVVYLLFATMYVIFKKCRIQEKKSRIIMPFIIINIGIVYTIFYNLNPLHRILGFMELTLVFSLIMISFWESCIQSGLIPSNSKYNEFFKNSALDAMIVDDKGDIHYFSKETKYIDEKIFEKLKKEQKLKIGEHKQLYSSKINGGYIVWVEELKSILSIIEKLKKVNTKLQDELVLIQSELQTQTILIKYKEKIKFYNLIKRHIQPQIKQIKTDLIKLEEDEKQIHLWKKIYFIGSYIKNCINLILISQIDEKPIRNFDISIKDLFSKLNQIDIKAKVENQLTKNLTIIQILQLYSIVEYIIEITFFDLDEIFLILKQEYDEINIDFVINGRNIQNTIYENINKVDSKYKLECDKDRVYLSVKLSDYLFESEEIL